MKKLFISQPMRSKSNEEILTERRRAILAVEGMLGEHVEVLDSFFENAPHDAKPLWYISKSIELLSEADVVYFVDGWQAARGCMIEYLCAGAYGKVIFTENES